MSNAPKPTMAGTQDARLAFECLVEQHRDVVALLTAIRDRYDGDDPTTVRLLEMVWHRAGEAKYEGALGDFFGVDVFAMEDGGHRA